MKKMRLTTTADKMTIKDVNERFRITKKAQNLSDKSLEYYNYCYQLLEKHVGADYLAKDITNATVFELPQMDAYSV